MQASTNHTFNGNTETGQFQWFVRDPMHDPRFNTTARFYFRMLSPGTNLRPEVRQ